MNVGVQTGNVVKQFGLETGYAMIREAGFDGIDWNLDQVWNPRETADGHPAPCIFEEEMPAVRKYFERELAVIGQNGLQIFQAHAPFPAYIPGLPELSARVPRVYENCIRFCKEAQIPYLVIHGISRAYDGSDMTREEMFQKNIDLYAPMIPVIRETGVMVLTENLFRYHEGTCYEAVCSDPDEAVTLLDTLNEMAGGPCFGLCFDVGHNNLLKWDMASYLRRLGSRVKALHLHDNDGSRDQHLGPYAGTVCWTELCSLLREIGYSGALSFETFNYYDLKRVMPSVVPVLLKSVAEIGRQFAGMIGCAS